MASDKIEGTSRTLASSLAAHLRATIMRGEIASGTKLNLGALRTQFDVSLSPLREALSRLAAEGLLVATDQRGYRVTALTRDNLQEIIVMRQTLEGLALHHAIQRNDPAWRVHAKAAHDTLFDQERSRSFLVEEWELSHRDYHKALIAGAAMPLLQETCANLLDRSDRYRRVFLRRRPKDRAVVDEHAQILVAALAGDSALAVRLLQEHIGRTGKGIFPFIEDHDGPNDATPAAVR